ncbi:hypothetical protein ABID21_001950 [Pseudorhizobium tarimense]|uniref:Uncharacterized protein n=1 Tax=Pseudorhizobium tarimense TaxID=1079109 RepID=A0ABV2H5S7_9HYPH|nr:hypothetical protein [Pseudorhizobium tarimense]MCJ8519042.1 hypothetical protein [Pseudorhizobium tarimense]
MTSANEQAPGGAENAREPEGFQPESAMDANATGERYDAKDLLAAIIESSSDSIISKTTGGVLLVVTEMGCSGEMATKRAGEVTQTRKFNSLRLRGC